MVRRHRAQSFPPHFQIFGLPPKYLPRPLFSPTASHISPVSSFLPSLLSYSRFLALAVSHPTAGVTMVFFNDLSSGSSSDGDSTTRVCLSSLSRAMTLNERFCASQTILLLYAHGMSLIIQILVEISPGTSLHNFTSLANLGTQKSVQQTDHTY